jgi:hypothetical protein
VTLNGAHTSFRRTLYSRVNEFSKLLEAFQKPQRLKNELFIQRP